VAEPLLLITRPGEPGRSLGASLAQEGVPALWWPAFDLGPSTAPGLLQEALAGLRDGDLAVFVSVPAVQAARAAWTGRDWPAGVRVAATGSGTARALAAAGNPMAAASVVLPESEGLDAGGAEALWAALQAAGPLPRRASIFRAQAGREFLSEALRAAGVAVQEVEAYRRTVHVPDPAELARLEAACAQGAWCLPHFTSSEAVAVLAGQALPGARNWARGGLALCAHERICRAAMGAGAAQSWLCAPQADALRQHWLRARNGPIL
jgi:uroporphyrinogen-III synthase